MRNEISIQFRMCLSTLLRKLFALVVALAFAGQIALAQTSSFTYQGKLADGGVAANGTYDITFKLYDTLANGTQIGADVVRDDVLASDGVFTVNLDFGAAAFTNGAARFLQIEVRPGASVGPFTTLAPRQPLTSSPFSIKTLSATSADSLSAACVLCVADGHIFSIDGSKVTGTVTNAGVPAGNISGVLTASQGGTGIGPGFPPAGPYLRSNGAGWELSGLSGDGSGLTNLNGTSVTGTVANATNAVNATNATTAGNVTGVVQIANGGTGSTTQNFVDLTTNQRRIGGDKEFVGAVNVAGANGVFSGNGSQLTNLNGANLQAGSVNAPQIGALAITSTNLGDGSVLSNKISGGAVTTDKLGDGSVTTPKLVDASVTAPKIANGSVTTPKLGDGSVTRAKLAVDFRNGFDPQQVALQRWDQIPVVPRFWEVGRTPSALAFDGTFVYVASKLDNNVQRIRTSTGAIEGAPITTSISAPTALVYDGTFVHVANSGGGNISRIRASTGEVETEVGLGCSPIAMTYDGTYLYVACSGSNFLRKLVAATYASSATIDMTNHPAAMVYDGSSVYVTTLNPFLELNGDIKRINSDGSVVSVTPMGATGLPNRAMAFDGTFIYSALGSRVLRIRKSTGLRETFDIALPSSVPGYQLNNNSLVFDGTNLFGSAHGQTWRLSPAGLAHDGLPIPIDGEVTALIFDGTYVYAATNRTMLTDQGATVINGGVTRLSGGF